MAFVLTSKQREFRFPFADGVTLVLRGFEGNERARYQTELAKIIGTKRFGDRYDKLLAQVAQKLLIRWEGVLDEVGDAIPLSEENKALFFADAETRKYWYKAVNQYLSPRVEEENAPEEGEEPDFLTAK